MVEQPFCHLFKTPLSYYVYDVNTDMILKIAKSTYEKLEYCLNNHTGINGLKDQTVDKMVSGGFLLSNRVKIFEHAESDVLPFYLKSRIGMITLQLTQNCNLRCEYCTYSGNYINRPHSLTDMDFETAKKGIEYLIRHSIDEDHISIGFYGGEPLLRFDFIQKCVLYAEEMASGKDLIFTLTTNGTLISEKIIEFFEDHNISILISLDGPREIHNRSRKFADGKTGSFDIMMDKVKMIKNKYPDYYRKKVRFNTVIDPQNDFCCVNEFFLKSEMFENSNFSASLISDRNIINSYRVTGNFVVEHNYEIFKLYLYELKRLDKSFVSKILIRQYEEMKRMRNGKQNTSIKKLPEKSSHGGPCIPGSKRLFLNANGDFYPCERVSESSEVMKIGNINDGIDIEKARNLLDIVKLSKAACKDCWAFIYCNICAGDVDDYDKLSFEKCNKKCNLVRNNIENELKDYCTLREFGLDFNDSMFSDYSTLA